MSYKDYKHIYVVHLVVNKTKSILCRFDISKPEIVKLIANAMLIVWLVLSVDFCYPFYHCMHADMSISPWLP